MHGLRGSNSRHLVLETSALPTELNPFLIGTKGICQMADTLMPLKNLFVSLEAQLPDLHLRFYHPHG